MTDDLDDPFGYCALTCGACICPEKEVDGPGPEPEVGTAPDIETQLPTAEPPRAEENITDVPTVTPRTGDIVFGSSPPKQELTPSSEAMDLEAEDTFGEVISETFGAPTVETIPEDIKDAPVEFSSLDIRTPVTDEEPQSLVFNIPITVLGPEDESDLSPLGPTDETTLAITGLDL